MPRFVFFIMGVAGGSHARAFRSEHCSLLNRSNNLSLPSDILQYPSLFIVNEAMQKSTSQVGGTVALYPFFPAREPWLSNKSKFYPGSAIHPTLLACLLCLAIKQKRWEVVWTQKQNWDHHPTFYHITLPIMEPFSFVTPHVSESAGAHSILLFAGIWFSNFEYISPKYRSM